MFRVPTDTLTFLFLPCFAKLIIFLYIMIYLTVLKLLERRDIITQSVFWETDGYMIKHVFPTCNLFSYINILLFLKNVKIIHIYCT